MTSTVRTLLLVFLSLAFVVEGFVPDEDVDSLEYHEPPPPPPPANATTTTGGLVFSNFFPQI